MVQIINPTTGAPLREEGDVLVDEAGTRFPIVRGIPRFAEADNYTESFGKQWNLFSATQIDRADGQTQSALRFFAETGWDAKDLDGCDLLEVGSGAGRFSRVVLEQTKARLWSIDYSAAVDANLGNNGQLAPDRFRLFQASIYEMPFPDASFDKVFCLGVLQHTPDFEASVAALIGKAKPGGEIAVDFYPIRGWWTKLHAKYILRPWTRRMPHDRLLRLIERNADWMIGLSGFLDRVGLGRLRRFIPVCDIRGTVPGELDARQRREWVILDTFDMFSPEYDNPQRLRDVAAMFERHGARVTFADYVDLGGTSAAVVRARRDSD